MTEINPNWLPRGKHWGLQIAHVRSKRSGLTLLEGKPKVVLHTFECPITRGAHWMHDFLEGSGDVVHITFNPRAGTVVQALPFNVGGYGLRNDSRPAQTNRAGKTVQIECSGYARDYEKLSKAELRNFAALLELINHRIKMGRGIPRKFNGPSSMRILGSDWANTKGIVGHCHVPENDHYDPGRIDMTKIVNMMRDM